MSLQTVSPITDNDTSAHMHHVLAKQRAAFRAEGAVSAEVRIERLRRLRRVIGENQERIIDACNADFGNRSRHQSQMSEVLALMDGIEQAAKGVKKWMKPEKRRAPFPFNVLGSKARVEFVPKGVIGVLGTWNFPVYTALLPVAGIFAAGNRAMVKLSELNPDTAALLSTLIRDNFDEAELSTVLGGPEVGAEFAALPFDHIIFTGGTNIGRHILQAAQQNLTPCTLELGGKSPVVVGRSADISFVAERIMTGKALNQGQACLAPDYCLLPKESVEDFVKVAVDYYSTLFPTVRDNPDYTSVINARHYQRLNGIIDDAREKGARIIQINPADEDFSVQAPGMHKIPMTLILGADDSMRVLQEELFGPVLAIKPYDGIDECIDYINDHPRPLGLYYFGKDKAEERKVLDYTISGGVSINDVMAHASCDDLPFGGIGHSGMGSYHGYDGFRTFSHARAVYRQTNVNLMKLAGMLPPFTDKTKELLDKQTKL